MQRQKIFTLGVIAIAVLILLYGMMLCAEFLAPYEPSELFRDHIYHPPNIKLYSAELGFGLQIQESALIQELTWQYAWIKGKYRAIHLFKKREPYRLLGFIPLQRRLFSIDGNTPLLLFGSDGYGRDIFSRILYGSRISLNIGFIGISISFFLAIILGGLAGYHGGWTDWLIMRTAELVMLLPSLYVILFLRAVFSYSLNPGQMFLLITMILSFVSWPGTARMVRGMVHSIKTSDFVLSAVLEGNPSLFILFRHILPHMSSILIVSIALGVPGFILGETVLSYLGLGISDPSVSWGLLISKEVTTISNLQNFPWILIPGIFLLVTAVSFTFLGEYLRDVMDPYHLRRKV